MKQQAFPNPNGFKVDIEDIRRDFGLPSGLDQMKSRRHFGSAPSSGLLRVVTFTYTGHHVKACAIRLAARPIAIQVS